MLRFTVLGSGSTGNATLIEATDGAPVASQRDLFDDVALDVTPLDEQSGRSAARPTRVLVDCGLTLRELERRLALRGVAVADIDAVFVTHEHSDHVGCLRSLVRRHRVAVWTSEGTWWGASARTQALEPPPCFARDGDAITIGALTLNAFAVPHDANEPLQLVASDGNRRLGIATDFGSPTAAVARSLRGVHALVLESNHDEAMLADGPYPFFLKRRIAGRRGHLANTQAAELLAAVAHDRLKHVVAAHLSRHNNMPALAAAGFAQVLGWRAEQIHVADPLDGTPWVHVG